MADFDWIIPCIVIFIVFSVVSSFMAMAGLDLGKIIWAVRSTRRIRTEMEPRDHYERWVHTHRRTAAENKPHQLKRMRTTGDTHAPSVLIGKVKGIEPWRNYYIVFAKTRRFAWSTPFIIPQWMASDINRRVLWVTARGFSGTGPIKTPIPTEDTADISGVVLDSLEGWRYSFEQQIRSDIQEDMGWDIGTAMSPPMDMQTRAAMIERPQTGEVDMMREDDAMGGKR